MLEDIGKLWDDLREYLEIKLDLFRLQMAEKTARVLSTAATLLIATVLLLFILLFISFSAGYYLGEILHSDGLGFLCVAGFYIILLLIILVFRKFFIERPVIKSIIKVFFPESEENEN